MTNILELKPRLPKIFTFINSIGGSQAYAIAVAEDGYILAATLQPTRPTCQSQLGVYEDVETTKHPVHQFYRHHYPEGYELEWVDAPTEHIGVLSAYEKNQKLMKVGQELVEPRVDDKGEITFICPTCNSEVTKSKARLCEALNCGVKTTFKELLTEDGKS